MRIHTFITTLLLATGVAVSAQASTISPAPAGDDAALAAHGRALFTGETPLANGGKACIACHRVVDDSMPPGSGLAPDLTNHGLLDERLLMAAMSRQRFALMDAAFAKQPVTEDEKRAIRAFLVSITEKQAAEQGSGGAGYVPLLAIAGGILVPLGVIVAIKKRRGAAK